MYLCKQCLDYLNSQGDHGFSRRLSWDDDVETTLGNWIDGEFIPNANNYEDEALQCEWCEEWFDWSAMHETMED